MFNPAKALHAYVNKMDNKHLKLSIGNIQAIPIKVYRVGRLILIPTIYRYTPVNLSSSYADEFGWYTDNTYTSAQQPKR